MSKNINQVGSVQAEWDLVLTSKRRWLNLNISDLWRYRELIVLFVKRDFKTLYKQTVLGPLWFIIQPLVSTLVFTVIFGNVAGVPTDGLPKFLFYLAGNVMWMYFANALRATSDTFLTNSGIFGKVYFPRLTVPISIVISGFFQFAIQISIFIAFYIYFVMTGMEIHAGVGILFLPLLVLQMACLGLGFGILISSMTTKYRDLSHGMAFGIQLWMYGTPIVYPLSEVPDAYRYLFMANPMTFVVESFRMITLGAGTVDIYFAVSSIAITFSVLIIGMIVFNRVEQNFMDTV